MSVSPAGDSGQRERPSNEGPPAFSIVTPSYNQGRFLELAMRSVLEQRYPRLEYVVMDGGSTDGSLEIIRKYEDKLHFWVSEHDGGQYDAISRGFGKTSGEIMAWLNADDAYCPWAFNVVSDAFRLWPEIEWLTTRLPLAIDADGKAIKTLIVYGFTREGFLRGENLPGAGWPATCFIQQESTFWRRSLWDRVGGAIEPTLKSAGDFWLWTRFFASAELYSIDVPLGCYRRHEDQKTSTAMGVYLDEAKAIFREAGGRPRGALAHNFQTALRAGHVKWMGRIAKRCGWLSAAPLVTYDWAGSRWTLERG